MRPTNIRVDPQKSHAAGIASPFYYRKYPLETIDVTIEGIKNCLNLAKGNKIIFTCAAKHIGLQLAKALISMEIPIAIAFGCLDASDIRLHYFSAKE